MQAKLIGPLITRVLDGINPGAIYTSPLKRALDTARIAYAERPAVICDYLRECAYGAYEGLTPAQVRDIRHGWDFWRDGCLDGENAETVGGRADAFLREFADREEPVIAFSHGHMIRILAACALGLRADQGQLFTLNTAAVSVIKDVRKKRVVALWNLTAVDHLAA